MPAIATEGLAVETGSSTVALPTGFPVMLVGQTLDTLLVASIPSTIALVGVAATIWLGTSQFIDTLKHERELAANSLARAQRLDRERMVRHERIELYGRLAAAASANLSLSLGTILCKMPEFDRKSEESRNQFVGILVETQILAHRKVVEAAKIDGVVNARRGTRFWRSSVSLWTAPERPNRRHTSRR